MRKGEVKVVWGGSSMENRGKKEIKATRHVTIAHQYTCPAIPCTVQSVLPSS